MVRFITYGSSCGALSDHADCVHCCVVEHNLHCYKLQLYKTKGEEHNHALNIYKVSVAVYII